MSETEPVAGNGSSTGGRHSAAEVVVDFLLALADYDLDAALDLVTDDLEYINVSLPTVHGRAALERIARPALRPGAWSRSPRRWSGRRRATSSRAAPRT